MLLGLSGVGGVFNEEVSISLYFKIFSSLKLPEDGLILVGMCAFFENLCLSTKCFYVTELDWFLC